MGNESSTPPVNTAPPAAAGTPAPVAAPTPPTNPDFVNLLIDGKPVTVKKGTNVIEAAKSAGIDIPHYCYHQNLSIAGNCRMCQVRVKGMPKMEIACNMQVREGMEVSTHHTSQEVADTQAAVLEFILINHPLDCTVCDQAGHCKLQDYHYEYNARPSRFLEEKEHKVKATPLGPHVMLDGERCIMCTRCIRFCDEVSETSELGMLNRGDRSVISINPGKELTNPLSGSVVDLCPVGALTHRDWRFNTRIWFTTQVDSICPGCSTGCNVKVASRDGEVVQVKARNNQAVNKEWLCDEGRYGFGRFLPKERLITPVSGKKSISKDEALAEAKKLKGKNPLVFVSPTLLVEEYALLKELVEKAFGGGEIVVAYRERSLTAIERKLISPDYAANFRGAQFAGVAGATAELQSKYEGALAALRAQAGANGTVTRSALLFVGDCAVCPEDIDEALLSGVARAEVSVLLGADATNKLLAVAKAALPIRSILERSGLLLSRGKRLQYSDRVVESIEAAESPHTVLTKIGAVCGSVLSKAVTDRECTNEYLAKEQRLSGLTIGGIKAGGVDLTPVWQGE